MAGKTKNIFVCNQCGYETAKWLGKCPQCNEWNTMEEQQTTSSPTGGKTGRGTNTGGYGKSINITEVDVTDEIRYKTGLSELDRVLGGGIVKGSVILLGGDPGIGKSTLMLQICSYVGQSKSILYVSGEESIRQIKLRADRLEVKTNALSLLAETDVETIVNTIIRDKPDVVIIDSIQTMNLAGLNSSPGSVVQVRESTNFLMHCAKNEGVAMFVVGHVNKDGAIAGPKVLEHIVDAVLQFEGQRQLTYRILRAIKNRYGSTNEIGVFQMEQQGLMQVENPSQMMLEGRPVGASGTCIACVMEGSRPILAEVQALATKSGFAAPRRMSTGFDYNRLNLLLAVLEKRGGFFFGNLDVYLNVIGGLRLDDPAADLAVLLSLYSSVRDKEIGEKIAAFGEIGLAGEIRSVANAAQRIKELDRLGFEKCILPYQEKNKIKLAPLGIQLCFVRDIRQAFGCLS